MREYYKVVKRLLSLSTYAEAVFTTIVEEEQSAEQCGFSNPLGAGEMNISGHCNFGISDMGAVDKNYLIQVSHLLR